MPLQDPATQRDEVPGPLRYLCVYLVAIPDTRGDVSCLLGPCPALCAGLLFCTRPCPWEAEVILLLNVLPLDPYSFADT